MKDVVGLSHREMADIYSEWNRGDLDSFLIEITANILKYKVSTILTKNDLYTLVNHQNINYFLVFGAHFLHIPASIFSILCPFISLHI